MRNTTFRGFLPLPAAVLLAVLLGCGGDLVLPDPLGADLDMSIVEGDQQRGPVGEQLALPLVVKVFAPGNRPASGRRVAFVSITAGAGVLVPDTTETNERGEAVANWVLGSVPGEQVVEARLVTDLEQPPITQFFASAHAGSPDTLRGLLPLGRPGRRGDTLEEPLVVVALDRFGNLVPNLAVDWAVTVGEGDLSAQQTLTGADGTASVFWTLGGRIGVQKVTATAAVPNGSPVTFSATVLF